MVPLVDPELLEPAVLDPELLPLPVPELLPLPAPELLDPLRLTPEPPPWSIDASLPPAETAPPQCDESRIAKPARVTLDVTFERTGVGSLLKRVGKPHCHTGWGKLTIHCTPYGSTHMPKYSPQGAFASGIVTFSPPPLSAAKARSASAKEKRLSPAQPRALVWEETHLSKATARSCIREEQV